MSKKRVVGELRISTKGRYALRFLIDLAERGDGGYISLKDVAERQDISKKYLEQIVTVLNQSGILRVSRGYQGGYKLARPPEEYTVGEILRLTEGSLNPVVCLDDPDGCDRSAFCKTLPVWEGLDRVVNEYLDSVTLRDLLGETPEAPRS